VVENFNLGATLRRFNCGPLLLQRAAVHCVSGAFVAGSLITWLADFGGSAVIVSLIYILGIVSAPFFPETRGKPLPE